MTKREFLDTVFALAPNEVNKIMDAFDEYVDSNEPHWIPVTEATPTEDDDYWATFGAETGWFVDWCSWYHGRWVVWLGDIPNDVSNVIAWCKPMEPYKKRGGGDGMSKIREAIKVLYNVVVYLEDYEEILELNNCNSCRNKNCPYRPRWGERVRINCPLYTKGEEVTE